MSLLRVLKYPDPVLKKKSHDVGKVNDSIRTLVSQMFETMYFEAGIGLAAPQVGEHLRVIVVDVPKPYPDDPQKVQSDAIALINPKIIESHGQTQFEEGCLSCPELIVKVDRASDVKVTYLDLDGKLCTLNATGLKAVCIQHEIDHLNGVLLADKVSRLERDLYKQKRIRLAKDEKDLGAVL